MNCKTPIKDNLQNFLYTKYHQQLQIIKLISHWRKTNDIPTLQLLLITDSNK